MPMTPQPEKRVHALLPAASLAVCAMLPLAGHAAEDYPSRPVRLIAPYGAGGSYDVVARLTGQKLGDQLGQQFIVDNRPGATGRIGMELALKGNPDGYTLVTIGNSQTIAPSVHLKVPYDLRKSIAPVGMVATITNTVVIHPSLPAQNLQEFIALAKAKPGTIRFGSGGTGGITHLSGELLANMTGAQMIHVPYKAGALAMNAQIGNEVQMNILNLLNSLPHIKAGRLRGVGVTGLKRSAYLPDMPTVDEQGVRGYEILEFHSLAAPAGTPEAVLARLNAEIGKALAAPDLRERLAQQAAEPAPMTPKETHAYILAEYEKYAKVVKAVGIKPD